MREMKDSGMEWIGEIPANWRLNKIKRSVDIINSGTTPPTGRKDYYEGTINWIQSGDLYCKYHITDTAKCISLKAINECSALRIYEKDFIIIAMYGASIGNVAISKINACVNQACCVVKPDKHNNLRFMYYWLAMCKSDFIRRAIGGTQPNISQGIIKEEPYLQPVSPKKNNL